MAAVREFLIEQRHRPDEELPRYGEVAAVYGGIARAVAPVLNSIARDGARDNEPDLSALVVLTDTGLPGRLNGQVVDRDDRRVLSAWQSELARIRTYGWARRSQ